MIKLNVIKLYAMVRMPVAASLLVGFWVCYGFTAVEKEQDPQSKLIGTWYFSVMLDDEGHKTDTIRHAFGWEIPTGPLMTFNEDGTYTKKFTQVNIDKGRWNYSEKKKVINYSLYLDKDNEDNRYIIGSGRAKKDNKGNYYQDIKDSVISLTENRLVVFAYYGMYQIYEKER